MAQFLSDNFSWADGTLSSQDPRWALVTGTTWGFSVSAEKAYNSSNSISAAMYRSDSGPASADYSVTADITSGVGIPGIIGRCSTSANTFYLARVNVHTVELYKFIAGSASLLSSSATGLSGTQVYQVRLEMIGSALKVYLNGNATPLLSVTDSSITAAGKVGMRQNGAAGTKGLIDNLSGDEAAGTTHTLTGSNGTQSNEGSAGAIMQTHDLAGAGAVQANTSSTGAAVQVHMLASAPGSQPNVGGTGGVTHTHQLAGENSTQANIGSTAELTVLGAVVGAPSSQSNVASAGAITQVHQLAGANATQVNTGATGALTGPTPLVGAPGSQMNLGGSSAVSQIHILAGANAVQANLGSFGRLVNQIVDSPLRGIIFNGPAERRIYRGWAESRIARDL